MALQKKIDAAPAAFAKAVAQQKMVTPNTKWVSFGGNTPGLVPAGTDDAAADILVYENVMAMIDTAGTTQAVGVGTMVRVGSAWRLIDVPHLSEDATAGSETKPLFWGFAQAERGEGPIAKPNDKIQPLLEELHKLGDISSADKPEKHDRRAELLEKIAAEADDEQRPTWYRQLADTLSAAAQSGSYPAGIERLNALHEKLAEDEKNEQLAFYVQYRAMTAEHSQALSAPDGNFAQIQAKWVADLKKFVEAGKKNPDSADAMMELAMAQELNGNESESLHWYEQLIKDFPSSPNLRKAEGARLRLTCEGKSIPLAGKTVAGGNFDLKHLEGKVVLIQYWATWCEPCKADMPLLEGLRTKYAKNFEVVGVCLDNDKKEMMSFLRENDLKWPQLFEEGGLDGALRHVAGDSDAADDDSHRQARQSRQPQHHRPGARGRVEEAFEVGYRKRQARNPRCKRRVSPVRWHGRGAQRLGRSLCPATGGLPVPVLVAAAVAALEAGHLLVEPCRASGTRRSGFLVGSATIVSRLVVGGSFFVHWHLLDDGVSESTNDRPIGK